MRFASQGLFDIVIYFYFDLIRKNIFNIIFSLDIFFWHIFTDVMPRQSKNLIESKDEFETPKFTDLEDLILAFDKDRNFFGAQTPEEDAMKLQAQFLVDFPPTRISEMNIDDYVIGKIDPNMGENDEHNFCYQLEFGIRGFGGIGGTPATKYGIYCDKKTQKYKYNKDKYDSPESAFKAIRSQLEFILNNGKKVIEDKNWSNFAQTLEGDFDIHRHVRSKILSVYYPQFFLQMHSNKDAMRILDSLFGIPPEEISKGLFLNQAKLLELKNDHPVMKKWSNYDYSTFIWRASKDQKSKNSNQSIEQSIWVVRAGGDGQQERAVLENDVIAIGWNELSDLSSIKNRDELREYYKKITKETDNQIAQNVGQIWSFMREIKMGDIVLLPVLSDKGRIVAVCKVTGEYQYKEITNNVRHIRRVIWLNKGIPIKEFENRARNSLGSSRTVYSLTRSKAVDSIVDTLNRNGITIQSKAYGSSDEVNKPKLTISDVVKQTYFPVEMIEEVEELLLDKNQIIFYGPPGTSKTYFAKYFSEYFTQERENITIIQFHQSYSYEDFIEGIKPNLSETGESNGFSRQPGLFKNLVRKCINNPDKRFVLIIDEINRGNISKIFGELIYLLEYRTEKIYLTYSPQEEFHIPKNLYIIGTMNSADRSIAFVDYALRRRFYFLEFYPDIHRDILIKWFSDNQSQVDLSTVISLLNDLNMKISEQIGREYQIGYSYFMKKDLDKIKLNRIIKYAIIPLVEQYFFGKKQKVEEIKQLCSSILTQDNSDS